MSITRFEDLIAWQKARKLTTSIYVLTRKTQFARDFGLSGQIQRATVSIMSNIAEGFERHRRTEFHQFLSVAKASCAEVRSLLYIAHDIQYITDSELKSTMALATEVANITGALRSSVSKPKSGS